MNSISKALSKLCFIFGNTVKEKAREIILIVLGLVIVLGALGQISFNWAYNNGLEQFRKSLESRVEIFNSKISMPTEKYSYLPHIVSKYQIVQDLLKTPEDPKKIKNANNFLKDLQELSKASTIYILDKNGLTIASSNWQDENSFVGKNFRFRPYFKDAIEKGEGKFYAMGVISKIPGYFISSAIKNGNEIIGVAAVKIEIEDVDINWKFDDAEMFMTDESGIIILSANKNWKYHSLFPLGNEILKELSRTRKYNDELMKPLAIKYENEISPTEHIIKLKKDENEKDAISYFIKTQELENSHWKLSIIIPTEIIIEQAEQTASIVIVGVILLLLLILSLVQLHARINEREKVRVELEENHKELQVLNEKLRVDSITDSLTNLANRRYFMEESKKMAINAYTKKLPLSIIIIDIDFFKKVNDTHGHLVGDRVLIDAANIIKNQLRGIDIVARFGGEEFIIALPNCNAQFAHKVAERIRIKLMDFSVKISEGSTINITASIGVSEFIQAEKTIDAAIKRADDALYEAKTSGRNRVITKLC